MSHSNRRYFFKGQRERLSPFDQTFINNAISSSFNGRTSDSESDDCGSNPYEEALANQAYVTEKDFSKVSSTQIDIAVFRALYLALYELPRVLSSYRSSSIFMAARISTLAQDPDIRTWLNSVQCLGDCRAPMNRINRMSKILFLLGRDGIHCSLCNAILPGRTVNFDHIIPRKYAKNTAYKDGLPNLRVLHIECNTFRGAPKNPSEWVHHTLIGSLNT